MNGWTYRNYNYAWSLLPGCLVIIGNLYGGWWVGLNTFFSLGLLAILERFVASDTGNGEDRDDWFPDALLYMHVILQAAALASLFYFVTGGNYSTLQFILASLSTGINTGASAIVIAHEMIHRKNNTMRFFGKTLLISACNIYFYIDHLKVHHKLVGTLADPATARKGESLYSFFIRTVSGQTRSAFGVEAKRLEQMGKSRWSPRNYVVASVLLLVGITLTMTLAMGWEVMVAFLIQGFFANFLLEYTNYIEHYGLTRNETERVNESHSWQTDKVISRYFLIDLSRHADHHYYASRPYHTLRSYPAAPVLPYGYVSMIYYALVPPLFFKTMERAGGKD